MYSLGIFYTETPPIHLGKRKEWNKCEKEKLLKIFHSKVYPEREEIRQLAKSLNTNHRKVENWFANMRRKKIREGLLIDSE